MSWRFSISFRTKIALLAGAITGGIVLGACALLWKMSYQFNLESLDRDSVNIAQAHMQRLVGPMHWERLDDSLSYVSGETDEVLKYAIWVESRGRNDFVSDNWPGSLGVRNRFVSWKQRREEPNHPPIPEKDRPISERNPALKVIESSFENVKVEGALWRVGVFNNFYSNLAIAVNLESFDSRMDRLRWRYNLVVPLALVLAVSGAWFVAKRSLRPVEKLTAAVEGVTVQALDQRIEKIGHEKEFLKLVGMFNEMMGRMETSFHQARRFSADASHELKTPLARLQMEIEAALRDAPFGSDAQGVYSSLLDELARLSSIVQRLTLLSLSDAGKLQLTLVETDLSAMLENVVEDFRVMHEEVDVSTEIEKGVLAKLDSTLFEQALQNLGGNAFKHGKHGGEIRFSLQRKDGEIWIRVANEGEAILGEDREKIFERFHQRDPSRSAGNSGVGLGLSLSMEIVRAHHGELSLARSDGEWTVFEIRLNL